MSKILSWEGNQEALSGAFRASSSQDFIHCVHCDNAVDTPEEIASYPNGKCPNCGKNWTGSEKRSTNIRVTAPEAISGSTL